MRFHDTLSDLFGNPIRVRILRQLTRAPEARLTGRELARVCGASPSQTIEALQTLEETGIVLREVVGPSHVWRLATQHILAGRLIDLFNFEAAAFDLLKAEVRSSVAGLGIKRAWVFGSIARRQERPSSDVDLFVEVKTPGEKTRVEDALSAMSPRFAIKFGNPLSTLVYTSQRLARPPNPELIRNVQHEGVQVVS